MHMLPTKPGAKQQGSLTSALVFRLRRRHMVTESHLRGYRWLRTRLCTRCEKGFIASTTSHAPACLCGATSVAAQYTSPKCKAFLRKRRIKSGVVAMIDCSEPSINQYPS